jgi:hypothetical protein
MLATLSRPEIVRVADINHADFVVPAMETALECNWPIYGMPEKNFLDTAATFQDCLRESTPANLIEKLVRKLPPGDAKLIIFTMVSIGIVCCSRRRRSAAVCVVQSAVYNRLKALGRIAVASTVVCGRFAAVVIPDPVTPGHLVSVPNASNALSL